MNGKSIPQMAAEILAMRQSKPVFEMTTAGVQMSAASDKRIAQPKAGSKEAQVRALRENRVTEYKPDSVSSHTIGISELKGGAKLAKAIREAKGTAATDSPPATSEESSSMRTKPKAKATGKPKGAKKTAKPSTERRKKDKRTADAPKPAKKAAQPASDGQTKGDQVLDALRKDWTSSKALQAQHGWQPHTLRGFLSRARLPEDEGGKGVEIETDRRKDDTYYRITK